MEVMCRFIARTKQLPSSFYLQIQLLKLEHVKILESVKTGMKLYLKVTKSQQ